MSPNTKKRILSALVIVLVLAVLFYLGKEVTLFTLLFLSMGIIDEVFTNFLNMARNAPEYLFSQISIAACFLILFFGLKNPQVINAVVITGVVLNVYLVYFLFKVELKPQSFIKKCKQFSFLTGFYYLLPLTALGHLLSFNKWLPLLTSVLIINFGMDTGAFIFGKSFGKTKLMPKVSPNKTVEGLLGGMLTSATLGGLFWNYFLGDLNPGLFILFALFGLISQLGDLIQSKLKRTFDIKDSSNIIPGHGGIYDRVDSLIFLAPFFAIALKYIY